MSRDLTDLNPELREIAIEWQGECMRQATPGDKYIFVCTYRSDADQQAAYDAGLSNAKPGQSKHNVVDIMKRPAARAFDFGVIRFGKYIPDGKDPAYTLGGTIAESLGLEWAGRWTGKIRETAHCQMKG